MRSVVNKNNVLKRINKLRTHGILLCLFQTIPSMVKRTIYWEVKNDTTLDHTSLQHTLTRQKYVIVLFFPYIFHWKKKNFFERFSGIIFCQILKKFMMIKVDSIRTIGLFTNLRVLDCSPIYNCWTVCLKIFEII